MSVNFVLPRKYRERNWPELIADQPRPEVVLASPHRVVTGVDAWIVQTWALLATVDVPFSVSLVERGIPGQCSVFHYDHARPAHGVHETQAVVVRVDRPPVPLADFVIEQNPCVPQSEKTQFLPSWPQPGLIPRDGSRGCSCVRLAYVGSEEYVPSYMKTSRFIDELRKLGVEFCFMHKGNWVDYSQVDALVAVRDVPRSVLARKPYAKLVNAWLAGIPIILGDEPAYRALRRSGLDYLEASSEAEVLVAVARLVSDSRFYSAMQDNALTRIAEFSIGRITDMWCDVLEAATSSVRSFPVLERASRRIRYQAGCLFARGWKIANGWNE
ncbi:hypothetical protein GGQ74_002830 [Desulfobaculum xiamenense]|uniref:Glycosyl transferases group 1 n=1 Tax=Desulfobaculum xiamenense TaxID=995050 RepID=A0A846QJR8_9BACT|nr:hypothetical protein [Desulfobaculum xiamenense]NJB69136.1 hypothetical protein [Desulfobaculum xiamenense]